MKNIRLLFFILTGLLVIASAYCQQTVSATGGNATGAGGTVAFSVGQVAYSVVPGADGFIIQGVQQPYEISTVTGIEVDDISLGYAVYPNPTAGMLRLVIHDPDPDLFSFQLYGLNGELLRHNKVSGSETEISMDILPASVYLLKILRGNLEVKVFRIVKR